MKLAALTLALAFCALGLALSVVIREAGGAACPAPAAPTNAPRIILT